MTNEQVFEIIQFEADDRTYYPASMAHESWMSPSWVKHINIDIPPGCSRYGGPVMDLPNGFVVPEGLRFAAQLDLSQFAPYDKSSRLPTRGQLIFFADIANDVVNVSYHDVPNDALIRHILEHDDHFFSGVLIGDIRSATESVSERFIPSEELGSLTPGKLIWNEFAGSKRSKIWGIYTHCQLNKEAIEKVMSGNEVLLQIGENGFNDEGVFSVLIPRDDLEKRRFDRCECSWAQT